MSLKRGYIYIAPIYQFFEGKFNNAELINVSVREDNVQRYLYKIDYTYSSVVDTIRSINECIRDDRVFVRCLKFATLFDCDIIFEQIRTGLRGDTAQLRLFDETRHVLIKAIFIVPTTDVPVAADGIYAIDDTPGTAAAAGPSLVTNRDIAVFMDSFFLLSGEQLQMVLQFIEAMEYNQNILMKSTSLSALYVNLANNTSYLMPTLPPSAESAAQMTFQSPPEVLTAAPNTTTSNVATVTTSLLPTSSTVIYSASSSNVPTTNYVGYQKSTSTIPRDATTSEFIEQVFMQYGLDITGHTIASYFYNAILENRVVLGGKLMTWLGYKGSSYSMRRLNVAKLLRRHRSIVYQEEVSDGCRQYVFSMYMFETFLSKMRKSEGCGFLRLIYLIKFILGKHSLYEHPILLNNQ